MAHLQVIVHKRNDDWVRWAQTQKEVTADAVKLEFGETMAELPELSSMLKSEHRTRCVSEPCSTVESVDGGNGLESLRPMNKYEPCVALIK